MNKVNIGLNTCIFIRQTVVLSVCLDSLNRQADKQTNSLSTKGSFIQIDINFNHLLHFWTEIN